MALLRITAMPCSNGALYYRRIGRCFAVGQSVEIEVSAEEEGALRGSSRLKVEAVEVEAVRSPDSSKAEPIKSEAPKAKGKKTKPVDET